MWQCWAEAGPCPVLGACVLSHRKTLGDRTLPPHILAESPWVQVARLRVCASLCSLFHVGTSKLRMDRGVSGPLTSWQRTLPEPHFRTPQQPFNTGKVSKKTQRAALGGPLRRMRCTAPQGTGVWVVMSLGELCCFQMGTRSGGAI